MLIGIDASRAVLARRTGTERYALEITRALIEAAPDDRFVLYFNQPPPPGLLPRSERVRWRVIPSPRLWTVGRLSLEMAARPPDVLFVPAHSLPPIVPRATVATIHDLGYLHFPGEHPGADALAAPPREPLERPPGNAGRGDLRRHPRRPRALRGRPERSGSAWSTTATRPGSHPSTTPP